MNNINTNISIKITGEKKLVLQTLDKIEEIFPLSVRSKLMPNDDGLNVHCWLTVAVEAHQDSLRLPAKTKDNFTREGSI
jgi:hypothetical protein